MIQRMMTLTLAAVVTSAAATAALAQEPPPRAPAASDSGTQASCLLKINLDPALLPLDARSIAHLVASSGVAGEAIRAALPEPPLDAAVVFEPLGGAARTGGHLHGTLLTPATGLPRPVPETSDSITDPTSSNAADVLGSVSGLYSDAWQLLAAPHAGWAAPEQLILGRLTVTSPRGKAREIMTEATRRLQSTLESAAESEKAQLRSALDRASARVERTRHDLARLQDQRRKMLESASLSDLARESILDMSRRMETERQDTAVRMEALRARQAALRERVAQIDMERQKSASEAAHAARDKLATMKKEMEAARSSGAAAAQVRAAQEALAKAEQELNARQAQLDASRGRVLGEFNDQLSASSIELAEAEMRLKALAGRCDQMRELLSVADQYELEVGLEFPLVRAAYENARRRQEELSVRLENLRLPTVTVLGG